MRSFPRAAVNYLTGLGYSWFRWIGLEQPRDWVARRLWTVLKSNLASNRTSKCAQRNNSQLYRIIGAVGCSHVDSTRSRYTTNATQLRQPPVIPSRNHKRTKYQSQKEHRTKYANLSLSLSLTHSHTFATLTLTYTISQERQSYTR